MSRNKSTLFTAQPLESNIFEWHFTIRGPRGTEFEGGIYHGKILLPSEYPLKPPDIIFYTPNGRFEVGKKVCLTISSHHAETWQPSWGVRTALLAIIAFMPTRGDGAIASLDWSPAERAKLARQSLTYSCPTCGSYNLTALPPEDEEEEVNSSEIEGITIKNKEQQEQDEKEKEKEKDHENDTETEKDKHKEEGEQKPQAQETPCACDHHDHGKDKEPAQETEPKTRDAIPDRQLEELIEELEPTQRLGPATFHNPSVAYFEENQRQKERCVKVLDAFIVAIFCCMALLIWRKFFFVNVNIIQ